MSNTRKATKPAAVQTSSTVIPDEIPTEILEDVATETAPKAGILDRVKGFAKKHQTKIKGVALTGAGFAAGVVLHGMLGGKTACGMTPEIEPQDTDEAAPVEDETYFTE